MNKCAVEEKPPPEFTANEIVALRKKMHMSNGLEVSRYGELVGKF